MTEENNAPVVEEKKEEKVMCFVSKKMVPMSETVEVAFNGDTKHRVRPEFIKY